MSNTPTSPLHHYKLMNRTARRSLSPLCALLFLLAAASSNAQQPNSQPAPKANINASKPAPETQPPTSGKAVAAAAPRTGSITGRVLGDDGRPVANAAIIIYGIGANAPPTGDMTDADGKFQIKDLRAGAYNVQATAPGYIFVPDAGTEFGVSRYYRVGENVTLTLMKGGVITGTVTNAEGEPVVAARVRAVRVRKPAERQSNPFINFIRDRMTDDRGVYRIYGLEPGTYVVVVGGGMQFLGNFSAYEGEAPTYYPSATRDTAVELTIHAGEELTGIDVRYRAELGHTISGFVSGNPTDSAPRSNGISVILQRAASSTQESSTYIQDDNKTRSFALSGIADGEYTLAALLPRGNTNEMMTAYRKVSVRGGDVTGIELKIEPLGALSGTVQLEPPPKADCTKSRGAALEEIVLSAHRDEKERADESLPPFFRQFLATPNDKGDFKLGNLRGGSYRLNVQLPGEDWYVRSIAMPASAPTGAKPARQSKTATPGTFTLKSGESMNGLNVTIGQGAAGLRGRVVAATEGATLPARLRVHLVPVEAERAADVLRYSEKTVDAQGGFALKNIAPGRYWLIARVAAGNENEDAEPPPVALETNERAKLRREAESAGVKIDLQPCQRLADYVLNYGATPPKPPVAK